MTPSDRLRAMAEEEEKRADELEASLPAIKAQIAGHREGAASLRKLADEMEKRAVDMPLTSEHRHNTLDTVNATPPSSNALRSQARLSAETMKTRFAQVIAKKNVTFADVAEALEAKLRRKFPRSTVQSWAKPKSDASHRGIPQDAADAFAAGLQVGSATIRVPLSAWDRVIPAP